MITTYLFRNVKKSIKRLKKAPCTYYKLHEEKISTTILFTLIISLSPLSITFDLLLLPFELIYLIVYKLLWKN